MGRYIFGHDADFSAKEENTLIEHINHSKKFIAEKCSVKGYPDIAIRTKSGELIQYLEVKVQRRAFMKIKEMLPKANLIPSETVALNLSDLLRYFQIHEKENKPITLI